MKIQEFESQIAGIDTEIGPHPLLDVGLTERLACLHAIQQHSALIDQKRESIARSQREAEVAQSNADVMAGFTAKAKAKAEEFRFSARRLELAAQGEDAQSISDGLSCLDDTTDSLEWWVATSELKVKAQKPIFKRFLGLVTVATQELKALEESKSKLTEALAKLDLQHSARKAV